MRRKQVIEEIFQAYSAWTIVSPCFVPTADIYGFVQDPIAPVLTFPARLYSTMITPLGIAKLSLNANAAGIAPPAKNAFSPPFRILDSVSPEFDFQSRLRKVVFIGYFFAQ